MNKSLEERGFYESEHLAKYDAYTGSIPIRYSKGCMRHIFDPASHRQFDSPLGFGKVLCQQEYEDAVKKCIHNYAVMLYSNTMFSTYEEKLTVDDLKEIAKNPEDILRRFYPSNVNWIYTHDGKPQRDYDPTNNKKLNYYLNLAINGSPTIRSAIFNIDPATKKHLIMTKEKLEALM